MISKNWEKLVTKYLIKKSNLHKNKLNKKNLYIFPNSNGLLKVLLFFFHLQHQFFIKTMWDY